MMTFTYYQEQAHSTAVYPHKDATQSLSYVTLGLANEAGEVAGEIKKLIRDDNEEMTPERYDKIVKEMGDVLWYLAELCTVLPIATSLESVARTNLDKLQQRKLSNTLKGKH